MPFIICGRERFALSIGETRIGGDGDDALPFPELTQRPTAATLTVTPDGSTTIARQDGAAAPVTVNGTALGADAVTLGHGAKIDVAGVKLFFGDLQQHGTTAHISGIDLDALPALGADTPGEPTADSGGKVTVVATGAIVSVPPAGLVIGRDPDCDIVLSGRDVSRRHATIAPSIQGYILTDTSTTGTYVNRRRVDGSQVLGMRDVIRVGDEDLRFEADAASFEPPPELRPKATKPIELPKGFSSPVPTAARTLLATLEIINEGPTKGRRFRLERPLAHVGRHADNEIHLNDDTVSGSHATLSRRGAHWIVTDHGSTNGTYVNGERIKGERELRGSAELRFGGVKMVFRPIGGSGEIGGVKKTKAVVRGEGGVVKSEE